MIHVSLDKSFANEPYCFVRLLNKTDFFLFVLDSGDTFTQE